MPASPREYYLDETDGKDTKQALATLASQEHPDGSPVVMRVATPAVSALDLGVVSASKVADPGGSAWRLAGWAVTEATGQARAKFTLRCGLDAEAHRLMPTVTLSPNESSGDEFPHGGMSCPHGVYLDVIEGSIDIVIYYREAANG